MTKYLYGASVQGIQGFIFQTNKLKEIVGASQLVDNINGKLFPEFYKEKAGKDLPEENIILNAAGNIKCVIENKSVLEKIVKEFPKRISNYAPGITISQTVVKYEEGELNDAIDNLEKALRVQRNKRQMPVEIGFMGLERARRTGGVAFYEFKKDNDYQDRGTFNKIPSKKEDNEWLRENKPLSEEDTLMLFKKFAKTDVHREDVAFDLKELTGEEHSWLAIVHADGNGLGNILQNMSKKLKTDEEVKEAYSNFSKMLEKATQEAAQKAFESVVDSSWRKEIEKDHKDKIKYPMRPVVLGGDDLTVIIRADLAYDFTKVFLKEFENATREHFADLQALKNTDITHLTACAGIAYIKDSYPFHYGVRLAEGLTNKAKDVSRSKEVKAGKKLPPSSLAFYKVQSSFTESLDEMIIRTHSVDNTIDNTNDTKDNTYKFFAGPYFTDQINEFRSTTEMDKYLNKLSHFANNKSKGISKLRQWITELHKDQSKANLMMDRIKEVNKEFYEDLNLDKENKAEKNILSDLIDLHTFNYMYKK